MNYLLIVILVLFAWSVISGYKKGFMKTVFELISWILVLMICNVATPKVADFIIEETMIDEAITSVLTTEMMNVLAESDIALIDQSVPEELKEALFGEGGSIQSLLVTEGQELIETSSLVHTIVSVFAFIVVVAVSRILMIVVNLILGIASKLPVIGSADKILGVVCGMAKGLLVSWVVLAVISVLAITGANTEWAAFITQSQLLMWLQERNFILNMFVLK